MKEISENLKTVCPLCGGKGTKQVEGFSSAMEMDAGGPPRKREVTCNICKGRKYILALDKQEMAERITELERENENLKFFRTKIFEALGSSVGAPPWEKITALKAQLAALQWTRITPENLPRGFPHDECLHRMRYVGTLGTKISDMTYEYVTDLGWTHFRPINAPPEERR